ncbi:MAG TPA: hypothetical protein VGS02_16835 [Acidobacteriaceae bacterium]|nr:hypothetical protein [Acidobacteriaceae bacterium]
MTTHSIVSLGVLPLFCAASVAQLTAPQPKAPAAIPMPAWRAAESYAIYSKAMPLGETASPGWPHDLWLIKDATITAVRPNEPCHTDPKSSDKYSTSMNPHIGVHPPKQYEQDFREILADFDAHCHESVTLDASLFETPVPVRLLSPAEQNEFRFVHNNSPSSFTPQMANAAEKFRGAPALYGFSEVYFNAHQTVALVYATHWCGSLCGQGMWLAFALENGNWKRLTWNATTWIS